MVGSRCLTALSAISLRRATTTPSATCSCRRGIETKFDVVSDASIQRAINLGQRAAQLARQRSKALAAGTVVAGFAGALEQRSCSGDPRGADRLGGSLEFVSRGCEGRKIARAGAGFDNALSLDRGVAKLPQKGIDGGLVTEPIGQNSAVDGSDRVRLGVATLLLAFAAVHGQPSLERDPELLDADRLGQISVHAGCEAALFLALYGVGSDRNDRRVDRAAVGFGGTQPPRQLMAIH